MISSAGHGEVRPCEKVVLASLKNRKNGEKTVDLSSYFSHMSVLSLGERRDRLELRIVANNK